MSPPRPNSYSEVCFDDAFNTAAATLKERAARHGAGSPEVKAWLAAQDAVFANCEASQALPPTPASAPAWLKADRAYQEAAAAFYDGRYDEAAQRFTAIAADAGSPWRGMGFYLSVRALARKALVQRTPAAYAQAHAALARLAAAPAGTYGQGELLGLENAIAFREDPTGFGARLQRRLAAKAALPNIAADFRDISDLWSEKKVADEALDWMATLKAADPAEPASFGQENAAQAVARIEGVRRAALTHALARWQAGHDVAWLAAAISLASPGDPQAAGLVATASAVPAGSPAWIDLQHHIIRLTLATAPAAATRTRLDAILARGDLSMSDRNVFEGQRTQVAASLDDFTRHALRRRICARPDQPETSKARAPRCVRQRWTSDEIQPMGVYDGVADQGVTGFGEDARAIIDRMPLAQRIALSRDARLPKALRLDVALTSYGRAVQLQDIAAIDALAGELVQLLPLMAKEFRDVRAAPPGSAKRFAEFLVLAKIPGAHTDLVSYVRPEGRRVAQFQGSWQEWVIVRRPVPAKAPALNLYQELGYIPGALSEVLPDALSDLDCLGECGRGASPLRLPGFIDGRKAAAERAFLFAAGRGGDDAIPAGAVDIWDEMLAYARAHPVDRRVPEALHWLVHVGRFGGSHNHLGRRAFRLLHSRYGGSYWAKKTPYYYD